MLMPLPAALRRLVAQYEMLLAEETLIGDADTRARLEDLAYTLCVATGTREITDALTAARSYLASPALTRVPQFPSPPQPEAERKAASSAPATAQRPALRDRTGRSKSTAGAVPGGHRTSAREGNTP
ncbi:DUF5133 domain-containing protein [Streptomyces sp. NPDC102487]|uniref:DUF5133 domain-containing protein n=1 Tax=Streptomyces sp. NPDC102487 TaxID=3366182 RepID=UPI0038074FA5